MPTPRFPQPPVPVNVTPLIVFFSPSCLSQLIPTIELYNTSVRFDTAK